MKRLDNAPELLDGPLDTELLAGNLRDLARVNRWLGGAALSRNAIAPFAVASSAPTVLDVGTGAGDIPRFLAARVKVIVTTIDIRPEIVSSATANLRGSAVNVRVGRLDEEPDRSHDVVHASMVLHHIEPGEAGDFLREAARVAREAVVINDLDRGWRWFLGAWLLARIATRNPYTRHDGPLSVRRAYTADEVVAMARRAGLRPVARYHSRPGYRYALVFVHGGD